MYPSSLTPTAPAEFQSTSSASEIAKGSEFFLVQFTPVISHSGSLLIIMAPAGSQGLPLVLYGKLLAGSQHPHPPPPQPCSHPLLLHKGVALERTTCPPPTRPRPGTAAHSYHRAGWGPCAFSVLWWGHTASSSPKDKDHRNKRTCPPNRRVLGEHLAYCEEKELSLSRKSENTCSRQRK